MKTACNICGRLLRAAILVLSLTYIATIALGYGDDGHKTVGAIADQLIANSPNTLAHVRALLGRQTLEKVSTWADDCKHDFNPNDAEMVAFTQANAHSPGSDGPHDHYAYHYTDIPIQEPRYRNNSFGAKPIDIVHMTRNCIAILEGHSNARNNPTNITQATALRLLVHYVGDIHQPLHVGAAYFGPNAALVNPNITAGSREDQGGNLVGFHSTKLHSYWDTPAVKDAMQAAHVRSARAFARTIVANPPSISRTGPFMSSWSVAWANEVLPIAKEAHNKLTFRENPHSWGAHTDDLAGYDQWAADQVRTEIGRAGYRLSAILKKIWP